MKLDLLVFKENLILVPTLFNIRDILIGNYSIEYSDIIVTSPNKNSLPYDKVLRGRNYL